MHIVFNVVSLYAAWFATVLAAANGRPHVAAVASLVVVVVNFALVRERAAEGVLITQAALVGLIVDGSLLNLGVAKYASPGPIPQLPPFWIISMWMAFATSLNVSLAWLKQRLVLATLLGAVGGPLAYYGGGRLGGMAFSGSIWLALGAVAVLWAAAFPLLLFLARRVSPTPA